MQCAGQIKDPADPDDIPVDRRAFDPLNPTLFDLIDRECEVVRVKDQDDTSYEIELDDWSPAPPIGPAYVDGWQLLGQFDEDFEDSHDSEDGEFGASHRRPTPWHEPARRLPWRRGGRRFGAPGAQRLPDRLRIDR